MATIGRAGIRTGPWATKPTELLVRETQARGQSLKRVVGLLDLTALGIGAIIGTGIFVIIGEAIGQSGPSIILSFVLAAVTCIFSALAYAELASTIPVAGSAYTYGYATMGELVAWIIGWDLILEYGVSVAAVAVGWSQYLNSLLDTLFGVTLPDRITAETPSLLDGRVNLAASFIVLTVTAVLVLGVRESARTNTIMVLVKLAVLALFIGLGITAFNSHNLSPFFVHGWSGVSNAASLIFFAYIGFDAISTSGEETRRPARDLPLAIIGSLLLATVLYVAVAIVATGALPFKQLNGIKAPLATVMRDGAGYGWAANIISVGALVAITSVCLTVMYGQTRIMFAMCRDGLVPRSFGRVSPRTSTPVRITLTFGVLVAVIAALVPLTIIFKLVNIGTLFAFIIVNIGVIVLRRTRPDLDRSFRVPLVPLFPAIGALLCLWLIWKLPDHRDTYLRFVIWLVVGLAIYLGYGRRHSLLQQGRAGDADLDVDGGRSVEAR